MSKIMQIELPYFDREDFAVRLERTLPVELSPNCMSHRRDGRHHFLRVDATLSAKPEVLSVLEGSLINTRLDLPGRLLGFVSMRSLAENGGMEGKFVALVGLAECVESYELTLREAVGEEFDKLDLTDKEIGSSNLRGLKLRGNKYVVGLNRV
jgi:hypothetical protein